MSGNLPRRDPDGYRPWMHGDLADRPEVAVPDVVAPEGWTEADLAVLREGTGALLSVRTREHSDGGHRPA